MRSGKLRRRPGTHVLTRPAVHTNGGSRQLTGGTVAAITNSGRFQRFSHGSPEWQESGVAGRKCGTSSRSTVEQHPATLAVDRIGLMRGEPAGGALGVHSGRAE